MANGSVSHKAGLASNHDVFDMSCTTRTVVPVRICEDRPPLAEPELVHTLEARSGVSSHPCRSVALMTAQMPPGWRRTGEVCPMCGQPVERRTVKGHILQPDDFGEFDEDERRCSPGCEASD
jgi:hypothetical protein